MMKKRKEFENILDECLERILAKGETIEQCLASYPEHADELEPLLQTAVVTREASAVKPRAEFMDRARYQFHSALQEMEPRRERRFPFFSGQPRWATVVIAVLVLLLASGGTVAAAGNSMPDEPLYPVKLATERVWVALTPSALGKAELYARLVNKRVAEIIQMASKGKPEQVERVTQRLNKQLVAMATLAALNGKKTGALPAPAPLPAAEEAPAPPREQEKGMMRVPAPPGRQESGMVKAPEPPSVTEEAPVAPEPAKLSRRAKLRMVVARHAVENPAALRAALQRVPASARPALLRAIALSDAEYEKVLKILEEDENQEEDRNPERE
jgi:hypothetical protein